MPIQKITQLFLVLRILGGISLSAQSTAADSVTLALNDYIDAFYYGDTSKIHRSIDLGVHKYGYYRPRNSTTYEGSAMPFREMIEYATGVLKKGKNPNVEKFPRKVEVYEVVDKTACGKVTAWWGTDYVLLAKLDGRWKITNVLWQSPTPKQ
ncbi:nuclear transport factor 2 family protein [Haliscomenobacter sp.]|uniref:nuclear transport factor 2 family protein n=1 Tax=Haliscomenobacter sp. TaxID=2717303 RepID=UPI003BABE4E4